MPVTNIKFPSGRSVTNLKKDAKRLVKEQSINHGQALNIIAEENGIDLPWEKAIQFASNPPCIDCETPHRSFDDMTPVYAHSDNTVDGSNPIGHVCNSCLDNPEGDYFNCWCCGDSLAYPTSIMSSKGELPECPEHKGESEPSSDEEREGWDSLIRKSQEGYFD